MSRLIHRPITVRLKNDKLLAFADRDFTHVLALIVDSWIESGQWWMDEPSHHVYTVLTACNYLYDIECVAGEWAIYRSSGLISVVLD